MTKKLLIACLLNFAVLMAFSQSSGKPYHLVSTIKIDDVQKWDYVNIDTVYNHLFVSHRTHTLVIDLTTEKLVGKIDPTPGVHGIAIADEFAKGFISNGKASTVTVFDLKTLKIITDIPSGGKDPDAILYDRFSKTVFVCNGHGNSITLLDPQTLHIIKTIPLPGNPEASATDLNGHIYVNIEDKSMLAQIDAINQKVLNLWKLDPGTGPTGIAMDIKNGLVFSGCRGNKSIEVVNVKTGKVIQSLPIEAKVDALVFDPATSTVFSSNGEGTVSVYKEDSPEKFSLIQTLKTEFDSKTMTMDTRTHKIYVPCFLNQKNNPQKTAPQFAILVYAK